MAIFAQDSFTDQHYIGEHKIKLDWLGIGKLLLCATIENACAFQMQTILTILSLSNVK